MVRQLFARTKQNGYIAISTVLILGGITTAITVSSILLSTDILVTSNVVTSSKKSRSLANGCAEYAINQLKLDINYSGNETINIGGEECEIGTITGTGNTNRNIQTQSTINDTTQKISVTIDQINPETTISNWEEIDDF